MTAPKRDRKRVEFTVSDEARAVLAEVPSGLRSQWVDEAIMAKSKQEEIRRAAYAQLGPRLGGMVEDGAREPDVRFDRRNRQWIIEYDTDPAICYAAIEADGDIRFERI